MIVQETIRVSELDLNTILQKLVNLKQPVNAPFSLRPCDEPENNVVLSGKTGYNISIDEIVNWKI